MLECGLVLSVCTEAYTCLSKLRVSLKLRKVCLCFQGVGVVVKFDVFALLCSLFVLFANKQ